MNIVDRRLNPKGKSLANRQRFLRRARKQVMEAVRDASARQKITEEGAPGGVRVRTDTLREPSLHHSGRAGSRQIVVPGNKDFVEGDKIRRPPQGGSGGGRDAGDSGESQDAFQFMLSQDEFLDLFFDDLELPDLLRRQMREAQGSVPRRAGISTSGTAVNLNVVRTMRNSLARRIALHRPRPADTEAQEEELERLDAEDRDPARAEALRGDIARARARARRIPFIDPVDIRYNRFEQVPRPAANAVMFCVMDVSGSMTEHMKDLAKRFYKLLYLFLSRRYRNVEIVFIRHTHVAREVDEDTFFHSTESGGTVVSTAFEEMRHVLDARYPRADWNVYAAQASDGDNLPSDNATVASMLTHDILPACQYFAYLEVGMEDGRASVTELWRTYAAIADAGNPLAMRRVNHRSQIYPVFRQLFSRERSVREEIVP